MCRSETSSERERNPICRGGETNTSALSLYRARSLARYPERSPEVQGSAIPGQLCTRRPGLIVSTSRLHDPQKVCWIAMISSADAGDRPDDIIVTDLAKAGLPVKCAIRLSRLAAIAESRIQRCIGTIIANDRNAVTSFMKKFVP